MKIQQGSVIITDIPFFHHIEVQANDILLSGAGDFEDETFSVEAIEALRDALTEAIRIKREMDGTPASPSPRVWRRGHGEPELEVTKVRDVVGDLWTRDEDGWNYRGLLGKPWLYVLEYAPLTDVTHA
jgi:hypothetical protein